MVWLIAQLDNLCPCLLGICIDCLDFHTPSEQFSTEMCYIYCFDAMAEQVASRSLYFYADIPISLKTGKRNNIENL